MDKNIIKLSDKKLILLLHEKKDKADQAFTVLHDRYSSKVYAYLKCMLNDADQINDIYQETFIRLYNNADPSLENCNLPAYLITTARNLCYNIFRNLKNTLSIDEIDLSLRELSYDERNDYEKKELFELIIMALDLLDHQYKEAFVMRKFDGLALNEIAEICGISIEGVKKRISRARKKIINILQPYLKDLSV